MSDATHVYVTVHDTAWAFEAAEVWRERLLLAGALEAELFRHGTDVRIVVGFQPGTNVAVLVDDALGGETGQLHYTVELYGFDSLP